jgi:hypothetical protein
MGRKKEKRKSQLLTDRYKRFITNNPFGGKNVVQANLDLSK